MNQKAERLPRAWRALAIFSFTGGVFSLAAVNYQAKINYFEAIFTKSACAAAPAEAGLSPP